MLDQFLSVKIMVLADIYGLHDLREACVNYAERTKQERTFLCDYKAAYDKLGPSRNTGSHPEEALKQTDIDFTKPWDHSDVIFTVKSQQVYANKMILSLSSPVMKTMFESDFKENGAKEIELPGKELRPFLDLLKVVHPPYRYKGNKNTNNTVLRGGGGTGVHVPLNLPTIKLYFM